MESGSKQDGVVNMTRAMEALSPLLNHPRRTIIEVEALVLAAAALLLLQLILGSCRRRWHRSFLKYGLQVCNGIMFPLTVYTLGTMVSSPVKNASYPVWAAFLIMASAGTTAVQQHDFYGSLFNKWLKILGEYLRDMFYGSMFVLLLEPNSLNLTTLGSKQHVEKVKTSSACVTCLAGLYIGTNLLESASLQILLDMNIPDFCMKIIDWRQAAGSTEETTANDGVSDSDPRSIMRYKYEVCYRKCGGGLITIDQIWDCGNSADANVLKDLCLSHALSLWLLNQRYFGLVVDPKTSHLTEGHDSVFKKLLPSNSEVDFKRAFRIIEAELGFCYDFFFTKYYNTFFWTNFSPVPIFPSLNLLKIILIVTVGVFAIRRSLVLQTPNPIIEVHLSEVDYIITLAVLSIALIVELAQAAFYLASNWTQVSLACMHVKKHWFEPNTYIFGKFVGLLRWVLISGQMRNKIDQYSLILQRKPQPVKVSDEVKGAIARALISTYGNNPTTNGETSLWQNPMFDKYSWALKGLSQVEVMLIWHIATEYCYISNNDLSDSLPRRNRIARDVAVDLSRYCAYLIGSVPELLPYHKEDIAELANEVVDYLGKLFKSRNCNDRHAAYNEMKKLEGTEEENDPTTMFQRGVKLGKQLEGMAVDCRWEVLEHFWAKMIIHFAASPYTAKHHMQHLEDGGEFLTHVWALLAHAGILSRNRNKGKSHSVKKDQKSQTDLESGPSIAA